MNMNDDATMQELQQVIEALPPDKKMKVIVSLHKITEIEEEESMKRFMSSLEPDVARAIAEIHLIKIRQANMQDRKLQLKQQTEPIRQSALAILTALISSGAKEDDSALVVRAASMAIKLHDFF